MTLLTRDPKLFSQGNYDLIIVGGGIYGVMLSLEAIRRDLRVLMIEKGDFINATSLNHLRTVHGGLRYLQSLDIPRFMESVGERKWFLKYFPQFVNPMACLMPLYNKGIQRDWIMRVALLLNDILSFSRNSGIQTNSHLPHGRVISAAATTELFHAVDSHHLKGSAVWYDASIQEFQRLLMSVIKLAVSSEARFLNYMEVKELVKTQTGIAGVVAIDREDGEGYQFNAPVVINAAGPWCRDIAAAFDRDYFPLFKKRLLLWNVLFNREALSTAALALTPERGKGRAYFFHPWKNRLLVGTGELIVEKSNRETLVPAQEMELFIANINKMAPGLNLTQQDIQRVYSGILPANENGTLSKREVILNHQSKGGPKGLYSVSGVKFTTSRLVAEKTLDQIFPCSPKKSYDDLMTQVEKDTFTCHYDWQPTTAEDLQPLKEIIQKECVNHLGDLVLRRTSLGDHPERARRILPQLKPLFNWEEEKWQNEVQLLEKELNASYI